MVFNAKITHCGQHKGYGDYFRVWKIETDMPKEAVIEKCFSELRKENFPKPKEWHEETVYGATDAPMDESYCFRGYYKLKRIEGGYEFTFYESYAD